MLFFYIGVVFDSPSLIIALYGIATPAIALYAISRNTDNFFIGLYLYMYILSVCLFYYEAGHCYGDLDLRLSLYGRFA